MTDSIAGPVPGAGGAGPGRWARWLWQGAWRLVLLAVVVAAAWALSNLRDAPLQPLPAALQLRAPAVADADNSMFDLLALRTAKAESLREVGRKQWQQMLTPAGEDEAAPRTPVDGELLPSLDARALGCQVFGADCLRAWLKDPVLLKQRRAAHVLLGARCEALLAKDVLFEEVFLANASPETMPMAPYGAAMGACSTWVLSGATQAWAEGRQDDALGLLVAHEQLLSRWRAGSRTLISHMLVAAWTRQHLRAVAELGLRSSGAAAGLKQALPDPRSLEDASWAWVPYESAFQERVAQQVKAQCDQKPTGAQTPSDHIADCGLAWFWLPNATTNLIRQRWLDFLAYRRDGALAAAEAAVARHQNDADMPLWSMLHWRNTAGHAVLDVSRHGFDIYLARQADALLHREVVAWFLEAQSHSAAPLDLIAVEPPTRWRERWAADRQRGSLSVRSYSADLSAGAFDQARFGIDLFRPQLVN